MTTTTNTPRCGKYVAIGDYPDGEYNIGRCLRPAVVESDILDHFDGGNLWFCLEHSGANDEAATAATHLPDASLVEFGSPAMDDLRFALLVLSLLDADRLDDLEGSWNSDTDEATRRAIETLLELVTHPLNAAEGGAR